MFGYVKPKREELKIKDDAFYRATYCGICKRMKALLGTLSTATLTYDSVFLSLMRMALVPDEQISSRRRTCALHPLKKRDILNANDAIDYTVRVFAELTYLKLEDDIADERLLTRTLKCLARPSARRACRRASLPKELSESMRRHLAEITALERAECDSVDLCASPFGELLAEVFSYGVEDESASLVLNEIGRHLGIFIYIADAAEDYASDCARSRYNPLVKMYGAKALTAHQREDIHTALVYHIGKMERALALFDFGTRQILSRLVNNIISLGLRTRIEFLKGE